jgi:hypothetical protein
MIEKFEIRDTYAFTHTDTPQTHKYTHIHTQAA